MPVTRREKHKRTFIRKVIRLKREKFPENIKAILEVKRDNF